MVPKMLLLVCFICVVSSSSTNESNRINENKRPLIARIWSLLIDMLSISDDFDQKYYEFYTIDNADEAYTDGTNSSYRNEILVDSKISWNGNVITTYEVNVLREVKERIRDYYEHNHSNDWLRTASDLDLLKFIRSSRESDIMSSLLTHNKWRKSTYGADRIKSHNYEDSILNQEVFWLGESKSGCPTMVVRSQLHDGADYNEDAKYFTGFLVWLLEEGKKKYGNKQVCVILDRSTIVFTGGYTKKESFDLGIIPNMVELFTTIYTTISVNYPDVLYELKIFPTSWFFSACYRITSRIFDSHTRNKFKIIQERDVYNNMRETFSSELIPAHLGGNGYKLVNWGVVVRNIPDRNASVTSSESASVNPFTFLDSFI